MQACKINLLLKTLKNIYIFGPPHSQLFQTSILVGGGSVINGAYPVYFLPLGRIGVTITSLSSIQVVETSPALFLKTPPELFESN